MSQYIWACKRCDQGHGSTARKSDFQVYKTSLKNRFLSKSKNFFAEVHCMKHGIRWENKHFDDMGTLTTHRVWHTVKKLSSVLMWHLKGFDHSICTVCKDVHWFSHYFFAYFFWLSLIVSFSTGEFFVVLTGRVQKISTQIWRDKSEFCIIRVCDNTHQHDWAVRLEFRVTKPHALVSKGTLEEND